jgi:hypothetical protein
MRHANYLDTLAEAFLATGDHEGAIRALERASKLNTKYRGELERLKAVNSAR